MKNENGFTLSNAAIIIRVGRFWQLEIPHEVSNVDCRDEFFCIFSLSFPATFEYPHKPLKINIRENKTICCVDYCACMLELGM